MPDTRHHRGPAPGDGELFNDRTVPLLRAAVADLSLLFSRGYARDSALKLVGDRYNLTTRQRMAVWRAACSDEALAKRLARRLPPAQVAGRELLIDGYNLLLTIESALGHATVFSARDTCLRDLAAVHGTYRTVEETVPALELTGETLAALGVGAVEVLLDAPVSNSGRLRQLMLALAEARSWPWRVELLGSPDARLIAATVPIATADSAVLDATAAPWLNLAHQIVARHLPTTPIIDLTVPLIPSPPGSPSAQPD